MLRRTRWQIAVTLVCASLGMTSARAQELAASPPRYVLTYPDALQFSPPVESYFDDVTQTIQKVGSRTFRHQPNGGYGLPVVIKVGGRHLLHLGADVAWHGVGRPVYSIADGVVRVSEGPPPPETGASRAKTGADKTRSADNRPMSWGNVIVIEHHLTDGSYVTSVYGHLSPNRLVAVGDVVAAGQMIGAVGKTGRENGGYKPHLHLGIREGRMVEPGCTLVTLVADGKTTPITVVDFSETEVEVRAQPGLQKLTNLSIDDHRFAVTRRDGKLWLPAAALNYVRRPDFPITGYALSTDGWRDPTLFLLEMLGKFPRAPFGDQPAATGSKIAVPKNAKRGGGGERVAQVDLRPGTIAVTSANEPTKTKRPKLYNPRAKGRVLVDSALKRAKAAGKRVLIVYGGNWCGWCYKLHDVFIENEAVRGRLGSSYELVLVDVDLSANKKLAASYKAEFNDGGLPYFTVLDSAGEVLANQVTSVFEEGPLYDPAKVLAFLEKYASEDAAPR